MFLLDSVWIYIQQLNNTRAPDQMGKKTSSVIACVISSPHAMFDHLLESSQWDDSNKWSNIGFDEEIVILEIKIRTLSGALASNKNMKWTVGM